MSIRKQLEDYGPIVLMGTGLGVAVTALLKMRGGGDSGFSFGDPRQELLAIASAEIGNKDWAKYRDAVSVNPPSGPIPWCGLFALWALHQAGLGRSIMWKYDGTGFLHRLPRTTNPQPGDMFYMPKNNHHGIVEKVDGISIQTIDGNSYGRQVARNRRPRADIPAFYSIQPLIDGTVS